MQISGIHDIHMLSSSSIFYVSTFCLLFYNRTATYYVRCVHKVVLPNKYSILFYTSILCRVFLRNTLFQIAVHAGIQPVVSTQVVAHLCLCDTVQCHWVSPTASLGDDLTLVLTGLSNSLLLPSLTRYHIDFP